MLCIGLHALGDDLATELLVRILSDMHIDARHLAIDEVGKHRPATLKDQDISAVCVVSVDPKHEKEMVLETATRVRAKLPDMRVIDKLPLRLVQNGLTAAASYRQMPPKVPTTSRPRDDRCRRRCSSSRRPATRRRTSRRWSRRSRA